ncbi:MAG: hypothetical protein WDM77_16460 [Steroidobacteraceae bacterium]
MSRPVFPAAGHCLREGHGFTHGLDNAGTHDLIGCLGRLAGTDGTEVRHGPTHGREHRLCAGKACGLTATHDGKGGIARAFHTTTDRTVHEIHAGARRRCATVRAVVALTVEQSMISCPARSPG